MREFSTMDDQRGFRLKRAWMKLDQFTRLLEGATLEASRYLDSEFPLQRSDLCDLCGLL